jgi:hypothetical protein
MNDNFLFFEISPWWLTLICASAALMVYFLYKQENQPWSRKTSFVLAAIRFLGIVFIALLLLNPFINRSSNELIAPYVPVVLDNSSSMLQQHDSATLVKDANMLVDKLQEEGYDSELLSLSADEISGFDQSTTDLAGALSDIGKSARRQYLKSIFLLSDGINNRGFSPRYFQSFTPIHTIAYGDTTERTDIGISEVRYNDIVYQDNKFPVEILISKQGSGETRNTLQITRGGSTVLTQSITIDTDTTVRVLLDADRPGLNRYNINIESPADDEIAENNSFTLFTDVIEGKDKILIVAPAPHPDIRALRSALEKNNNYETNVYIPRIAELDLSEKYDVVIRHDAGDRNFPNLQFDYEVSTFYLVDPNELTGEISARTGVTIETERQGQTDRIKPAYNANFQKFSLNDEFVPAFEEYPTVEVTYGEYAVAGPVDILVYQQLGSVVTSRPLLSVFDDGRSKSALLLTTGIWKWRLQEAAINDNPRNFDEMISKTVQLLSVKGDKRKFRLDPTRRSFSDGENVQFKIETYSDIYERTGGEAIELIVQGDSTQAYSFSYTSDEVRNTFNLGSLPAGIYSYTGRLASSGQTVTGEFLVRDVQIEKLTSQANHGLLRQLSQNNQGSHFHFTEQQQLEDFIDQLELSGSIETNTSYFPLINLIWLLIIIFTLFSVEWFFRKFLGAY